MKLGIRCRLCGKKHPHGIHPAVVMERVTKIPAGVTKIAEIEGTFVTALEEHHESVTKLGRPRLDVTKVQTPAERQRRHRAKEG